METSPRSPSDATRPHLKPVLLDARQAFRAMLRFASFASEPVVEEPDLPLLLGILLGCAEEPHGFTIPVGYPTGCSHGGSGCAPTLGNSSIRFFTTERIRRILQAVRDGDVGPNVREVLQAHLRLVAPGNAPNTSWVCSVGWFKERMLECVHDPVPKEVLYGECVALEELLKLPLVKSCGD